MSRAVLFDQRSVHLPAVEVARTLPRALEHAGVRLDIAVDQPRAGTATPGAQRFPATWHTRRASGPAHVEVAPLSQTTALIEVCLPATLGRGHAEALRDTLEGRPCAPPAARPSPPAVRRLAVAAVAALVVVAGVSAFQVWTRPQPVSVELAAERYRETVALTEPVAPQQPTLPALAPAAPPAEPATPVAPPKQEVPAPIAEPEPAPQPDETQLPSLPEPGVYRYATTGWEELSMPGSRRSFPSETAQTLTHTACGFQVSWQPLEERRDAFELCVDNGRAVLASVTTYRSFFEHAHEQRFACNEVPAPADAMWSVRCQDGDTTMEVTARPQGQEVLDVAGQPVSTLRMRMDSRIEGDTTGTRRARMWFQEENGLVVRTEVSSDLQVQGPFGRVRYREEHTLHLTDPTPQQ